jgi:hypothetical protein
LCVEGAGGKKGPSSSILETPFSSQHFVSFQPSACILAVWTFVLEENEGFVDSTSEFQAVSMVPDLGTEQYENGIKPTRVP